MKPSHQVRLEEYQVFRPNYTFTFIIALITSFMFYGTLLLIQASNNRTTLMTLIPMAFQLLGWVICLPFIRSFFAVVVSREGVKAPSGVIPGYSQRLHFKWEMMKSVRIQNYGLLSFIEIANFRDKQVIIIPVGLDHHKELIKTIKEWSPANCPLRLLTEYKIDQLKELKPLVVQISGHCQWPTQKIIPFSPVLLKKNEIILDRTKADHTGKFYFESKLLPGSYTLSVETFEYEGQLSINVEKNYLNNLVIPMQRRWVS